VLDAAIALYAETGWAGFTYEALARRSGVGKASLYGRWPARGDLLRLTFERRWFTVGAINTGDLRGDLIELSRMIFTIITSANAGAGRWMGMDAMQYAEVRAVSAPYTEATIRQGRAIVRRAIARGEIAASVNPGLLMDLVVGGVTNHVSTTPPRLRPAMISKMIAFTELLVDTVLRGARC
jgi:AcrR family transcriptional regulator